MAQLNVFVYITIFLSLYSNVQPQVRSKNLRKFVRDTKHSIIPFMSKKIHKFRTSEICYDSVGCFEIPRHHNPLQKFPENPAMLATQFYLFKRELNFSSPNILNYGDNFLSLNSSKFNPTLPVKIIIHGYMTKWNDVGALVGAKTYLKIGDYNVILMDWEKGARGPSYGNAAANTELVGRELGFLLLDFAKLGVKLTQIHLIGFSLGAHVAACASQQLKDRGLLIGRITGLDPASPLFKLNHFRDNLKKLDISDAKYVDIIHTDGSPVFSDGFGLLEPLGHVDYFPNGGREQPGCSDVKRAVIKAQFDKTLDREIACSHIRAYHIFLETLVQKSSGTSGCEFNAYKCPKGLKEFTTGRCFPVDDVFSETHLEQRFRRDLGKLGEDSVGDGAMYLVTRGTPPFCGSQLQATVQISHRTKPTRGILFFNLQHGKHSTSLQFDIEILDLILNGKEMYSLGAAEFGSITKNTTQITAHLFYTTSNAQDNQNLVNNSVFINRISVRDLHNNSWQHCEFIPIVQDKLTSVQLTSKKCSI